MLEVTSQELKTLPRWARVAFSVRCAQRVSGLIQYYWREIPKNRATAVERALEFAVAAARDAKSDGGAYDAAHAAHARAAARAAKETGVAFAARDTFAARDAEDFVAVAAAVAHAASAVESTYAFSINNVTKKVTASRVAATRAGTALGCEAEVANAQRYDFLVLKRLAGIHRWDDDSPVPPELCGPIWPEGVPEKWPLDDPDAENRKKGEFVDLTFDLPPDVDDETAQQVIRDVYEQLNGYHIAHGGSGLVLDNYQAFEPQPAEVSV
jgi:hypothetical protein